MNIIEFFDSAIGSSDDPLIMSISVFCAMFISLDFIHVFFQALTSLFKK